jgi:glutamate/tyrosine decarboxylase-like PLP-dependent enzyme
MGNVLAICAARDAALGADARTTGIGGAPLVAYAARGAHSSIAKAMRMAGLGTDALRAVDVDERFAIDVDDLRVRIAADRAAGLQPFLVVATAGTVDTGAFDPLDALADLCKREGLWLHVDGAFGALAITSPRHAHLVDGINRADSLAFDAHKWLQAPYAVGCVLFRDERTHRAAFSETPDYLAPAERGTAAGAPWYAEYGLELSRDFRALRLWMMLHHYGIARFGEAIAASCDLTAELGHQIEASPELELMAPVFLNVVCFRVRPPDLDEPALDCLNAAVAVAVQEGGEVVLSTTRIGGRLALRGCLINHRTVAADVADILEAIQQARHHIGATQL